MMKYSIKTVDGNRYDYHREDGAPMFDNEDEEWITVNTRDGTSRMFLRRNVVSVTARKEDNV